MRRASTADTTTSTPRSRSSSRAGTSRRRVSTPKPVPALDLSTFHKPVLDVIAGLQSKLDKIQSSLESESSPNFTSMPGETNLVAEMPTYVERALGMLHDTLSRKGQDYSNRGEFGNFEEQARIAGTTVRQV